MRGGERRTISNEAVAEMEDGRREAVSRRRNFIWVGGSGWVTWVNFMEFDECF